MILPNEMLFAGGQSGRSAALAKKKDAVALFEVISKTRQKRSEAGLGVPVWMSGEPADSAQPPSAPSATSAAPARRPERSRPALPAAPMIASDGKRLTFSLNYYVCVGVLAGAVLLLTLVFYLGYLAGAGGGGSVASAPAGRIAGKYYLIIERLRGATEADRAEADRIVSFCAEHGEPAIGGEMPAGDAGGKR